jgi:hypothetical protein
MEKRDYQNVWVVNTQNTFSYEYLYMEKNEELYKWLFEKCKRTNLQVVFTRNLPKIVPELRNLELNCSTSGQKVGNFFPLSVKTSHSATVHRNTYKRRQG